MNFVFEYWLVRIGVAQNLGIQDFCHARKVEPGSADAFSWRIWWIAWELPYQFYLSHYAKVVNVWKCQTRTAKTIEPSKNISANPVLLLFCPTMVKRRAFLPGCANFLHTWRCLYSQNTPDLWSWARVANFKRDMSKIADTLLTAASEMLQVPQGYLPPCFYRSIDKGTPKHWKLRQFVAPRWFSKVDW